MNTNDLLANWSTLSLEEIEARLDAGQEEAALAQLFGAEEVAEMREVMAEPPARGLRPAVVLLPGIMGSLLASIRGVTQLVWINPLLFLKGESSYVELDDEGRADRRPEVEIAPVALERLCYAKIGIFLRRHVELYEFPYDWRRPVETNGDLLCACIERWADGNPDKRFTLLGHSMGGLVSRAYLARRRQAAERRVQRVIMLGTPHFGAATAVENLLYGNSMMALVAKLNAKNAPRRLLVNLPSAYSLLPAPPELFPSTRPYPANWDLYDASAWQLDDLRQDYLDAGRRFHQLLAASDPQVPLIEIAGCHQDTIVEVQRKSGAGGGSPYDVLRTAEGPDSGDGTVPLWSAVLPGAAVYYVPAVHRYLPKNRKVMEATRVLIHGGRPGLPADLPAREPGPSPRAVGLPVEQEAERLRQRLAAGTASEEDLTRLYFAF